ncbi:MAG: protein kinase domain-containing protein [Polyangiaceae bacterium]
MTATPRSSILVVDDEPWNRDLAAQQLEMYDTRLAASGEEALAMIAAAPPDLVLLDVMMPGIDGFEVCRRLKADDATRLIPIVIMTALDAAAERIKGIEAGADDFLTKPVDERQLLARIRTALRAKHFVEQKLNAAETLGRSRPPRALGSVRACGQCCAVYTTETAVCKLCGAPVVFFDKDPLVGRQLDRYLIQDRWGSGGMGCVYVASHATLKEQTYAIKVLYGEFAGQEEYRQRFAREAEACAKLDHPNVVTVLDFATTPEGLKYMVMEFVQGRTLREVIDAEAPLPFRRAASIARQVASALACAHARGIVHRDVKPANIMVAESELGERVTLLDFGIVLSLSAESSARLTATGVVVGTPLYMAPEQIKDGVVTPSTDLYALGVTMYEMICGRAPFDGSALRVAANKLRLSPNPPSTTTGLDRLTWSLLAPSPDDRPKSGEEVVAALDALSRDKNDPIVPSLSVFDEAVAPPAPRGTSEADNVTTRLPSGAPPPVTPTLESPRAKPDETPPMPGHWVAALVGAVVVLGIAAAWAAR